MKLLALDTATEACSAALMIDHDIRDRFEVAPREHSRLILPMIEQLLAEAGIVRSELDAVAFGRGPGSFMGVRIATGVTQGIAYAHDLPVVPVSTLAAIAQRAHDEHGAARVYSAIDARMGEVYWGAHTIDGNDLAVLEDREHVIDPRRAVGQSGSGWVGAGTGWATYREELESALGESLGGPTLDTLRPGARAIARLAGFAFSQGQFVTADKAVPVYLRDKVASKPGEAAGT